MHLSPGSEQSPIVKSTDMPRPFSFQEWPKEQSTELQSGTTCERSRETCSQKSTLFQEDFPARTSALQELERAWEESEAGYFLKLCDWLASFDPASFSWKTSQLSLFEGSTEFVWNSLRSGTIVGGRLYQPQNLEPRTSESAGGFLPAPTAAQYGSGNNGARGDGSLFKNPKKPSLNTMARHMPTPCARDWKDGLTPARNGKHSPSVAVAVAASGHTGYLNPAFVEVIMGFPIGWTDLGAWATALCRKPQGKRLGA